MNLDDMIAAERAAPPEASQADATKTWKSIEMSFVSIAPVAGAPAAAAKASTLGKIGGALSTGVGKVVLATTLVTGAAVGTSRLGASDPPTATSVDERSTSGTKTHHAGASAPKKAPSLPTLGEPEPAPAPVQPAAVETQPSPSPAPVNSAAPKARRTKASRTTKQTPSKAKPKASIQEELALIRKTQSAIRSGAHQRALKLVRQHAASYPDGALEEDREALRALALCGAEHATASTTATKFLKRWPQSMHRSRIEAACE